MTTSPSDPGSLQTVYVVEDDADAREMLAELLKSNGLSVHCFATAEAFLQHGAAGRPGCAVVDLRLPGMSGLDLHARLDSDSPQLPVIVITGHGDVATARAALLAGARDFLEKPLQPRDLLDAVSAALESDTQAIALVRERARMADLVARLTPREHEVFQRITDGLHNREIAVELGISPRTVEVHRARLMEKLKVRRLADLFRLRVVTDPSAQGSMRLS